jgi:CheY-like chemotaxis protein
MVWRHRVVCVCVCRVFAGLFMVPCCCGLSADAPANRRILKRFLTKLGVASANLTEMEDGQAALAYINSQPPCDIMFMDIEMPHVNGDQVVERTQPPFPVIAVTANAGDEDRKRYIRVGFSGVLTKPFDQSGVRGAVEEHILRDSPAVTIGLFGASSEPGSPASHVDAAAPVAFA